MDLLADLFGASQGRGRIARDGQTGDLDVAQVHGRGLPELLEVIVVILLDLRLGQRDRRIGHHVTGHHRGELHRHSLMSVPIRLPQRPVGEVHIGRHDPQQLAPHDLFAILRLELRDVLPADAGVEPPLVFRQIELPLSLELRHVREFLRRAVLDRFCDLLGVGADVAAFELRAHDLFLDQVFPHLISDFLDIVGRKGGAALPLAGVDGLLQDRLVGVDRNRDAVDHPDRGTGAAGDLAPIH